MRTLSVKNINRLTLITMLSPIKNILFAAFLICFGIGAQAQVNYRRLTFRIDSLADMGLPKSALKETAMLDSLARKNNNVPMQVKAAVYRMTFQSYLQDNALAAIITRLKQDIARSGYPVKPVLQSILAGMYSNYYQQNIYRFSQRSRLAKPDSDFTKWDLQTIISATSHLYTLSLADTAREQHTPIGILDGVLTGDSSTRYLRPTLYDLLTQRALDFFLSDAPALPQPKMPFSLSDPRFFGDSRTFAGLKIKTSDTASTWYKGMKYLQQATGFHLQHQDDEALANLDLQRLKFLYDKSNAQNKDALYRAALGKIAADFSAKPISAEALVLEGKYYQNLDSLVTAHRLFEKAAAAFPHSLGGKNAAALLKIIENKDLSAKVEDANPPGQPILTLLNYTNVTGADIAVYHLTGEQARKLHDEYDTSLVLKLVKQMKPVQQQQIRLPGTQDYRPHSTEIKIDPLAPGNYLLFLKDSAKADKASGSYTIFQVTNLAYAARVNPDGQTEFRVMNRIAGKPLDNVNISIYRNVPGKHAQQIRTVIARGISDADGKCIFDKSSITNGQYEVVLSAKDDRFDDRSRYFDGYSQSSINPAQPQTRTILFTDRQLYRPGQTIYFKALQISTLNGKSTIIPNANIVVDFKDLNNKTLSSLELKTNDYGSAQGSFIIPQNITDGSVSIGTGDGRTFMQVEEYKRPSFEVSFSPVTKNYHLTDSVDIKGAVTAFSGYGISNAKVVVHVTQSAARLFPFRSDAIIRRPNNASQEILADTLTTDSKGKFEIHFKPGAYLGDTSNTNFTYSVNADVIDGSGETQSASTSVTVGKNPLSIAASLPDKLLPGDTGSTYPVKLMNLNNTQQKGSISIKVYAIQSPGRVYKNRLWDKSDEYVLTKAAFVQDFPDYSWKNEDDYHYWQTGVMAADTVITASDTLASQLNLSALKNDSAGMYKIVMMAKNAEGDTASSIQYLNLIGEHRHAQSIDDWVTPLNTSASAGQKANFLVGIGRPANVLMQEYDGMKMLSSRWLALTGGEQQKISVPVCDSAGNALNVQFLMVNDNRIYHSYSQLQIADTAKKLDIRFLTFRNKLQPGQKEQWKLEITDASGEKQAAEMLADLYDASLNSILSPQPWQTNFNYTPYRPSYFEWMDYPLPGVSQSSLMSFFQGYSSEIQREYEKLDLSAYENSDYNSYRQDIENITKAAPDDKKLAARYAKNAALVKNGYDVIGKVVSPDGSGISGAKISIRHTGIFTFSNSAGYFRIRVPVNGILLISAKGFKNKQLKTNKGAYIVVNLHSLLNDDVANESIQGNADKHMVIEADANSMFSPQPLRRVGFAAPVVKDIELKTNAQIYSKARPLPSEYLAFDGQNTTAIPLRKNFNETAFFYPQLHTDSSGRILIDFTIPEALTQWRFRAFAHTKDLRTGYIERTIVTQKQLSISANMPRFLRAGDTITVSARLANLTAGQLSGKVQLQLYDALNMQPVSILANKAGANQRFTIDGNSTKAVSFTFIIPQGLEALDYRLTADAGQYSDGEENTLPVLPDRMLVTESMPMMVRPGQTRDFTFDKLIHPASSTLQSKTLTLEYTSNPAWYAVQALPYLMEYPYECSEQVFSRYFANSLATDILKKMPHIQRVFNQWKAGNSTALLSNLEQNQELKQTLIEETPWLQDAQSESEQKKRIALLFDMNKMSDELKANLEKLQKRQLPDGGFNWFGGSQADRYITQDIVEGIGELNHLGIGTGNTELAQIASNAIGYLDDQLLADEKERKKNKSSDLPYSAIDIQAWFARSFFLEQPMDKDLKSAQAAYLQWAEKYWAKRNIYEEGMIALTMLRYSKPDVTGQIERSLLEKAQQLDDMGMYWPQNTRGYFWYESPIETQSLMIDLFTEAGDDTKAVDEMKIWLLRNKQTNNWKTTTATAQACYALLLKGGNLLADTGKTYIKLDGKPLGTWEPDIKTDAGTGYLKTSWADEQVKPGLGRVEVRNTGANISWGALYWQYLEKLDKITSAQTDIQLQRKYFIEKQTATGPELTEVDAVHQPKVGDLLKVVIYLKAGRDYEYVQLKDMRPSGTEPADVLSEYKYQDGLYHYQVTKDAATSFFVSELMKGSYVFEYRLRVAQPGDFSTGITSIQCMYAPEYNAHSEGKRMQVRP